MDERKHTLADVEREVRELERNRTRPGVSISEWVSRRMRAIYWKAILGVSLAPDGEDR